MWRHRLGNTFPIFSHFFGLSYQAAHVNSLARVTLFRNICIPFFSYDSEYLEDNKHSGSQFELHTHSRLLVVNINRKKHSFLWRQSTKTQTNSEIAAGVDLLYGHLLNM